MLSRALRRADLFCCDHCRFTYGVLYMANPKGNPATLTAPRFKPGQSGNPQGNPASLRQQLQASFTKALRDDFEKGGIAALEKCRLEKPEAYIRAIAGMMPKEIEIKRPLEDLNDEQLIAAVAALQSFLAAQSAASRTRTSKESKSIN